MNILEQYLNYLDEAGFEDRLMKKAYHPLTDKFIKDMAKERENYLKLALTSRKGERGSTGYLKDTYNKSKKDYLNKAKKAKLNAITQTKMDERGVKDFQLKNNPEKVKDFTSSHERLLKKLKALQKKKIKL